MSAVQQVRTRVGTVPVRVVGDGPVVLAVHGLLTDGRLWDGVAAQLDGHVRLVLPDLPLGAHSRPVPDRARLTPDVLAQALLDLLDELGLDSAVLLGNDTGGALVQLAAAARPDRVDGLVLAGCDAFANFPPPLLRPLVLLAAVPGGTRVMLRAFAVRALLADPGRFNLLTTRGLGRDLVADLLTPARTDRAVRADLTAVVRSLRPGPLVAAVPALRVHAGRAAVVWGRRDRIFPAGDAVRLAELLDTTVTWADDAATFVPHDRPDLVAEAVRSVVASTGEVGRRG